MANTVPGPRVPGSEHIPFRPINPHGSKPVVKDRNGNLIEWKSPLREQLYQVMVEDTKTGQIKPAFPAMTLVGAMELCAAVTKQIKAGFERDWSNPTVVKAS